MNTRLIVGFIAINMLIGATNSVAGFADFIGSVKDSVVSGTKTVGRAVGLTDYSSGLDGRLIDVLIERQIEKEVEPKTDEQIQVGFRQDLIASRRAEISLAPIAELNKYLNHIKDKLLAVWTGAPVHAHVYLTSSKGFKAVARKNGAILISLGVLLNIEDEDHLAALIGHELSHLILAHHEIGVLDEITDKALDYADLILRVNAEKSGGSAKEYAQYKAVQIIAQSAFFPQWKRGQENEADILGVDLLIGAGYNGDAMRGALKIIGETAQKKQAFIAANPIEVKRTNTGDSTLNINAETMIANVSEFMDNTFGSEHEGAQERRKRVRDYMKEHYKNRERPESQSKAYSKMLSTKSALSYISRYKKAYQAEDYLLDTTLENDKRLSMAARVAYEAIKAPTSSDAYTRRVLYQVRKDQKKDASAEKNLQVAYASGNAPYDIYITLANRAYQKRDYKKSLMYLNEMVSIFGEAAELLPKLIAVNTKLGNVTQAFEVKCLASGKVELIKQCRAKEWDARTAYYPQQGTEQN